MFASIHEQIYRVQNLKYLLIYCIINFSFIAYAEDDFSLQVVTNTRTQIVLKWDFDSELNPLSFELERSTSSDFSSAETLSLLPSLRVYSDTGYSPDDRKRLSGTNLVAGINYYYRLRAQFTISYSNYSNIVSSSLSCPVRGEYGDLWADVVLGQPDFYQNSRGRTTKYATDICGGVLIDNSVTPERAYIVDTNHSRILGFSDLSTTPWEPDLVIGQPDYTSGAPNGIATAPCHPELDSPSAETLALVSPTQLSVGEAVLYNQMVVDENGSLYVADVSNNRILKYEDPFLTDTVADDVWGQPDFTTRTENYGGRSASSLYFIVGHTNTGLAIGPDGSLWVADSGNLRVLRFPSDGNGSFSKTADLVLGQNDFTSISANLIPSTVQIDSSGVVYVAWLQHTTNNPSKITVYEPPFFNGMAATRTIADNTIDLNFRRPNYIVVDPLGRGIWVQSYVYGGSSNSVARLLDPLDGTELFSIETRDSRGFSIDSAGNLYIHLLDYGVYKYESPYDDATKEFLYSDEWIISGQDFWQLKGMAIFGDQLIVCEAERLLIWDDYLSVDSYAHADDVWGQDNYSDNDRTKIFQMGFPTADGMNRLWVYGQFQDNGWGSSFKAFDYPLTHESVAVQEILETIDLLDESGSITLGQPPEPLHFAFDDDGDQMWIADWVNSRVVRVNNVTGGNNPSREPYVDVILGQPDSTSTDRNQGAGAGSPQANTLDLARYVSIGTNGDLYVSDNSGEGGTNCRILVFDQSLFPDELTAVQYAVVPTDVYGTGGAFDVQGCVDETCAPLQVGFSRFGHMVFGSCAYNANDQYYPICFLGDSYSKHPDMALGDFGAIHRYILFDEWGNLYVGDYGWARILIYKRPFLGFEASTSGLDSSVFDYK